MSLNSVFMVRAVAVELKRGLENLEPVSYLEEALRDSNLAAGLAGICRKGVKVPFVEIVPSRRQC